MKEAFEILDHTADIGVMAYGTDFEELFSNAALALFSLITDLESIQEKSHFDLEVRSKDRDSLLVALKATCYGEAFDPNKHKIKIGVKAATYHMLRLDTDDNGHKAQVILDI
jgi:SHS2 domain-containing protein